MLSRLFTCTIIIVTLLTCTATSFAGWRHFVDPDSGVNLYYEKLDGSYGGSFAMFQYVGGMRFYVFVEGADFDDFYKKMKWGTLAINQEPNEGGHPYVGGIMFPSKGGTEINFKMYASDYFQDQYGKPLRLRFLVLGKPGANGGVMPKINIDVDNAHIDKVKVNYGRTRVVVSGTGTTNVTTRDATVNVTCGVGGAANALAGQQTQYRGGIGGILVGGGFIGECKSGKGIPMLVARCRNIRKFKLRMGGSIAGDIVSRGAIRRIIMGGGLGIKNTVHGIGSARKGSISAGWDGTAPYMRNIKKVVLKRGGNDSKIAAGDNASAANYYFMAGIKKIKIRNRNGSGNPNLDKCQFISQWKSKVVGDAKATATDSNLDWLNGTADISTL